MAGKRHVDRRQHCFAIAIFLHFSAGCIGEQHVTFILAQLVFAFWFYSVWFSKMEIRCAENALHRRENHCKTPAEPEANVILQLATVGYVLVLCKYEVMR